MYFYGIFNILALICRIPAFAKRIKRNYLRGWKLPFWTFHFTYKLAKPSGSSLLFMYSCCGLNISSGRIGCLPSPLKTASTSVGFSKKTVVFPIIVLLNIGPYFLKAFWRAVICSLKSEVRARLTHRQDMAIPLGKESRRTNERLVRLARHYHPFSRHSSVSCIVFQNDLAKKLRSRSTQLNRASIAHPYSLRVCNEMPGTWLKIAHKCSC